MEAVVNEDGTLSFLGMKLKQITPGVFADTAGDPGVAVVQFLLNDEGKVERIVTASGETYLPLSFWESPTPSKLLLYLLIGLAVGFLLAGVFSFLKYLMTRYHDHAPGFIYTVPLLFAALMSLFVLLQVWVGFECGAMAFSSFFAAMSGITLVCGIGATIGFLVSFIASLTRYRMSGRVASSAVFFILFLFLVNVWGLITF